MSEEQIKKIMEMCEKAAKGPWTSFIEGRDFTSGSSFIRTGNIEDDYEIEFIRIRDEDQDFIAMARNVIPELIDEINRLKDLLNTN